MGQTIKECVIEYCESSVSKLFMRSDLIDGIAKRFGINPGSIIPSDYCYNRLNAGIRMAQPFLERIGHGEYKYLGKGYPYTGIVSGCRKGSGSERIVGHWSVGEYVESDAEASQRDEGEIISGLYEEYMRILTIEQDVLGSKPTECRALIGRIGEFKAVMELGGRMAQLSNQRGWDVSYANDIRVSVKTTAQKSGFVSISKSTLDLVDEIRIYQFRDGNVHCIAHGQVHEIIPLCREWQGRSYEFDISKAKVFGIRK